mgnify:CR=1 FL=1
MHSSSEIRNTNCDASSATLLEVANEWPPLYTSCTSSGDSGDSDEQEQPSTNSVEEFGHFINVTLLQETRLFSIATMRKCNWKSRWNNVATLTLKQFNENYHERYKTQQTKSYFKYSNILKLIKCNDFIM